MKLLYISHLHPPPDAVLKNIGGMQRVSMQLLSEFEQDPELEVSKITLETGWKFIGLKTFFFLLRLWFFLPSYVKKNQSEIILFSSMVTGSVAWFIRKRVSIPMVTISHGHDVKLSQPMYQWLVPKTFNALDGVISVSSATRDECIKRGLEPAKGVVLPNGFDAKSLGSVTSKKQARLNLESVCNLELQNKKILLTVGRLIKRKGHEWFIREVLPLTDNSVIYLIIGDGSEKEAILKSIEESGMQNKVLTLGRQPDEILDLAYSAADLFIMPNIKVPGDMEGFGIVLLEANIHFTPALATNIEGMRDVIEDGENGFKIPLLDHQKFADTINELVNLNLNELSTKSSVYARTQFNWSTVAGKYKSYLKRFV